MGLNERFTKLDGGHYTYKPRNEHMNDVDIERDVTGDGGFWLKVLDEYVHIAKADVKDFINAILDVSTPVCVRCLGTGKEQL